MNIKSLKIVGCLAIFGCASPDVSSNIGALNDAFALSSAALTSRLEDTAESERLADHEDRIQWLQPVYELEGACDFSADRAPNTRFDCRLQNLADASDAELNASQVLLAMRTIEDYLTVISLIATSESAGEIRTLTNSVLSGINNIAPSGSGAAANPVVSQDEINLAAEAAGFITDQYRMSHLRRAIRSADPVIEGIANEITGYFRVSNDLFAALHQTQTELNAARLSGDVARYRRANVEFKSAFDAVIAAETASPANLVWLLRDAHADLLAHLNNPSIDEINDALVRIQNIRQLAQTLKG